MIKLILLALGIWFVYRLVTGYGRSVQRDQRAESTTSEDMVRCVHCGVHLPRSESTVSHGEFFCTNEHRQLHQK
ncbi:MAG: PP0621 family protein [Sulfuricella sp.]|nr:PP0621 family protein [Sulfuricella sp.]